MFHDPDQQQIHDGNRDGFRKVYNAYSRDLYAVCHTVLGQESAAKDAVRQIFLHLFREIMRSDLDVDIPVRLCALTNEEIRITRLAGGDLSKDILGDVCGLSFDASTGSPVFRVLKDFAPKSAENAQTPVPADGAEQRGAPTAGAEPSEEPAPDKPAVDEAPADAPEKAAPAENPADEAPADAKQAVPETKADRGLNVLSTAVIVFLSLVFLWLLAGILMDFGVLPFRDLGFRFFNEHVFEFFRVP